MNKSNYYYDFSLASSLTSLESERYYQYKPLQDVGLNHERILIFKLTILMLFSIIVSLIIAVLLNLYMSYKTDQELEHRIKEITKLEYELIANNNYYRITPTISIKKSSTMSSQTDSSDRNNKIMGRINILIYDDQNKNQFKDKNEKTVFYQHIKITDPYRQSQQFTVDAQGLVYEAKYKGIYTFTLEPIDDNWASFYKHPIKQLKFNIDRATIEADILFPVYRDDIHDLQ